MELKELHGDYRASLSLGGQHFANGVASFRIKSYPSAVFLADEGKILDTPFLEGILQVSGMTEPMAIFAIHTCTDPKARHIHFGLVPPAKDTPNMPLEGFYQPPVG